MIEALIWFLFGIVSVAAVSYTMLLNHRENRAAAREICQRRIAQLERELFPEWDFPPYAGYNEAMKAQYLSRFTSYGRE